MFGVYKTRNLEGMGGGGMGPSQYAQLTAGGAQNIIGLYSYFQAQKHKKAYDKLEVPQYTENAAMAASRLRADENAKQGFTPVQHAMFFSNLAKLSAARLHQGQEMAGGSLATALNAGNNINNINALNNFSVQDANLQQNNIRYADMFARNLQTLQNMNTQNKYKNYIDTGQAITTERNNAIHTFINGFQTAAGAGDPSDPNKNNPQRQAPVYGGQDYNMNDGNSGTNDNIYGFNPYQTA